MLQEAHQRRDGFRVFAVDAFDAGCVVVGVDVQLVEHQVVEGLAVFVGQLGVQLAWPLQQVEQGVDAVFGVSEAAGVDAGHPVFEQGTFGADFAELVGQFFHWPRGVAEQFHALVFEGAQSGELRSQSLSDLGGSGFLRLDGFSHQRANLVAFTIGDGHGVVVGDHGGFDDSDGVSRKIAFVAQQSGASEVEVLVPVSGSRGIQDQPPLTPTAP